MANELRWGRGSSVVQHASTGHTDRPMHVTIVVSSTQRRGAEVFASHLAEALPDHGWAVDFVALADRPDGVTSTVPAEPLSLETPESLGRLDLDVVVDRGQGGFDADLLGQHVLETETKAEGVLQLDQLVSQRVIHQGLHAQLSPVPAPLQ